MDYIDLYSKRLVERPPDEPSTRQLVLAQPKLDTFDWRSIEQGPRTVRNVPVELPVNCNYEIDSSFFLFFFSQAKKRGRKINNKRTQFRCNVNKKCKFTTPDKNEFRNHLKDEFGVIELICKDCNEELTGDEAENHKHHEIQPYNHANVPGFIEQNIKEQMKLMIKKNVKKKNSS